ncbi:MAG: carbamoyltransferase N-terminal domain-containing protein, partial [Terriglobales bacterium]
MPCCSAWLLFSDIFCGRSSPDVENNAHVPFPALRTRSPFPTIFGQSQTSRWRRQVSRRGECLYILGINAYHGDAAAALVKDGHLVAAVEEERFNRKKHCAGFPTLAV